MRARILDNGLGSSGPQFHNPSAKAVAPVPTAHMLLADSGTRVGVHCVDGSGVHVPRAALPWKAQGWQRLSPRAETQV